MSTRLDSIATRRSRRVLVVVDQGAADTALPEVVDRGSRRDARILVVAPALTGRLAYWTSGDDGARRAAQRRLAHCLETLRAGGLDAEGLVGDADPLLAIDDALRLFPADEIVVATQAEQCSNWLARDLVGRARRRFLPPIRHVVVGGGMGHEAVAG